MHRSGTSAVTRILNLLGAGGRARGRPAHRVRQPRRALGEQALVACNDRILAAFGRSWDFPPWLAPGWEHTARGTRLVPELAGRLRRGVRARPLGVEGPPHLPHPAAVATGASAPRRVVVFVWRDPGAVVRSVWRRDGIPTPLRRRAVAPLRARRRRGAVGLPALCVRFEDLVDAPTRAVGRASPTTCTPSAWTCPATATRRRLRSWTSSCTATPRAPLVDRLTAGGRRDADRAATPQRAVRRTTVARAALGASASRRVPRPRGRCGRAPGHPLRGATHRS